MQKELPTEVTAELTEREQEILKLLATGTSNKEIANLLYISSNTVKVHLRNIFAKIGAASRTEAAMYAIHSGLVRTTAPEQVESIAPPAEGSLMVSQAATTSAASRTRPSTRLATMTAVILVLVVITGMGILLTRQQAALATGNNQTLPTAESRWHILADLPSARSGLAAIAYENQIYAIGGESAEGVTGVVERYDPSMDSWAELAQKPVAVTDINAAVIGGRIYVPGGRQANNEVTAALEYYDPRQNSWGKGLDLPTPLSAYALAAFEGRLYLFGGWDGKNYLDSVYMYDPSQDKWSALTPMSERRGFAGAAVAGDKIYIMGGYDGKQALANNDVYTPHVEGHGSPWSPAKALPSGYYDLGVASVADNIYVIGRQGSSKIFSAFVPPINDWQTFDPPTQEINEGSKLTQLGQYLFIVGGKTNGIPRGMTLIYQAIYSVQFPLIIQK